MTTQELFIKNMVCNRCIRVVQTELERLGHNVVQVELGRVIIDGQTAKSSPVDLVLIDSVLREHGFALLTDKTTRIVSQIKTLIIGLIQNGQIPELRTALSSYLEEHMGLDYAHLSHLFSKTENLTIEKFWIMQRVERAKELLSYDELPISDIARQLGYSSAAYLTNQFKSITGLTPTTYRNQNTNSRTGAEPADRPERRTDRNPLDWI